MGGRTCYIGADRENSCPKSTTEDMLQQEKLWKAHVLYHRQGCLTRCPLCQILQCYNTSTMVSRTRNKNPQKIVLVDQVLQGSACFPEFVRRDTSVLQFLPFENY